MKIHGNTAHLLLDPLLPSMVNLTSLRIAFVSFSSGTDFHACIFKLLRLKEHSLFCISNDKRNFSIKVLGPCSGPALESIQIEGGDKNIGPSAVLFAHGIAHRIHGHPEVLRAQVPGGGGLALFV